MFLKDKMKKQVKLFVSIGLIGIGFSGAIAQTTQQNQALLREMASLEKSTVVLNNEEGSIPLKDLDRLKIASVNFGPEIKTSFDSILSKYAAIGIYSMSEYHGRKLGFDDLHDDLKFSNLVIFQLSDKQLSQPDIIPFIKDVQKNKNVIVSVFGNGNVLRSLDHIGAPLIWSEKNTDEARQVAAQIIFGGIGASGKLNKDLSPFYKKGMGAKTLATRLKYTVPEALGISSGSLKEIDEIAAEAIREKAAPSIVVMVVKKGNVIFNKAYGTHTYIDRRPTQLTDIYDLASVTKISATTMAVMRLYEEGKLKLDTNIGAYIPKARKTDKKDISVREVMLHQAGFIPFIPFYRNMNRADLSRDSSSVFPTKVADGMFIRKDYFKNSMWPAMLESKGDTRGKYVYSDLSMYFMKEMVERQSGVALEKYVQEEFYQPLGMTRAGFNPRYRFPVEEIIPTEDDQEFRKTLLRGYVHDQGAAMVGGVSGHAGLFSSANDLAILYQMILNKGTYGGESYFKPATVEMFTAKQSDISRRGLGFDRWDPDSKQGYPSKLASPQTFGHTGYTGTCIWVDPKHELIYIFLSNRVNPTVSPVLSDRSIRGRIQDVVYRAIGEK